MAMDNSDSNINIIIGWCLPACRFSVAGKYSESSFILERWYRLFYDR